MTDQIPAPTGTRFVRDGDRVAERFEKQADR
ncbi:hypothetical protein RCH12_002791 [Cryobacterium sp. MP_3.1]|nr:hypothetical protein [Cryobacterium sp. MP_3.1]